jgi:hypothetical protein
MLSDSVSGKPCHLSSGEAFASCVVRGGSLAARRGDETPVYCGEPEYAKMC